MQIGVIGLGRMGGNITRRLMENGHETVVYDHDAKAVAALAKDGAGGAFDLKTLVQQLRAPRAVWVMLPAGKITEDVIGQLAALAQAEFARMQVEVTAPGVHLNRMLVRGGSMVTIANCGLYRASSGASRKASIAP